MKKEKDKNITNTPPNLIKPGDLAFHARQILLSGTINTQTAHKIIEEIIALNTISQEKIVMRILSSGGSATAGLAIIDTMRILKSPVITYITGEANSMGGLIGITGNLRVMSKYATMLLHPMSGGNSQDYYEYQKDRLMGLKLINNILFKILKKHTKLNKIQLDKIKNGELWLTAKQCLKYGVVDKIV